MNTIRQFLKFLPTLALSFALSIAVWISAVTSEDPSVSQIYSSPIPVEITGLSSDLVLVGDTAHQATVTINAPRSEWSRLNNDPDLIKASVDLTGLGTGEHTVAVKISLDIRAATISAQTPENLTFTIEKLASKTFPITLIREGEPSIGFQADEATLDQNNASVSGPESQVGQVSEVRAVIDLADAHESIKKSVVLTAMDENENPIENLTINPVRVQVEQTISQQGGYRSDLVVKPIYQGRLADGYHITSISVFPPAVTVYSSDPTKVNDLPGYLETEAISLDGVSDNQETRVALSLPEGVTLVGDQSVLVQIGIEAIESSLTLSNQVVEITGLGTGLTGVASPEGIDIIISGPLPLLDAISPGEVRVYVDVTGLGVGTHQVIPQVELRNTKLTVESILPGTLEVEISVASTASPTP